MIYGSVCSGIEAASVAWEPLGWTPAFFSEIELFPCAVLAHHYGANLPGEPVGNGVPNHGDMTQFKEWPDHAIDLLVGGTPCQSFSVAGLRKGLADPRGNLMLTYLAIAERYQPRWLVWENVPGVLSSGGGRDFGTFLGALGELGYGFAWRVLDAQYIRARGFARAVPQRRRRVFVVGYRGDARRAAAVLFDRESLSGRAAPGRKAGQGAAADVAPGLVSSGRGVARAGESRGGNRLIAERDVAGTVSAEWAKGNGGPAGDECQNLVAFDSGSSEVNAQSGLSPTLRVGTAERVAVAFDSKGSQAQAETGGASPTLRAMGGARPNAGGQVAVAIPGYAVRRLMPVECERLQGFPDGWTQIPWRGKEAQACPDGPRYKALGNSMAVNVMRWLGERIALVEGEA